MGPGEDAAGALPTPSFPSCYGRRPLTAYTFSPKLRQPQQSQRKWPELEAGDGTSEVPLGQVRKRPLSPVSLLSPSSSLLPLQPAAQNRGLHLCPRTGATEGDPEEVGPNVICPVPCQALPDLHSATAGQHHSTLRGPQQIHQGAGSQQAWQGMQPRGGVSEDRLPPRFPVTQNGLLGWEWGSQGAL